MKNLILFLIVLISNGIFAQESFNIDFTKSMATPGANFYEIIETADAYFIQNPDESEGGAYSTFKRWEWFWNNRVHEFEGNPGSFIPSFDAIQTLTADPICDNNNNSNSNWNLLGPIQNLPVGSGPIVNIGRIMALAVDPNDHNIMYVGSNSSGLFKTTNALDPQPVWSSVMDDEKLPGIGINHVLIDPLNSDIIYVATGYTRNGGYGIGILKSVDGGNSWDQINPDEPGPDNIGVKMVIDHTNSSILYALISDKIYKTTNGGTNWNEIFQLPNSVGENPINPNGTARFMKDIAIHPTNPDIIYVAGDDHIAAIATGWIDDVCVEDGTTTFCEDFETGGFLNGGWVTQGNILISTKSPNQGNYCVRGTDIYSLEKEINGLANNIIVEFSCKAIQTAKRNIVKFILLDEQDNIGPYVLVSEDGNIAAYDGNNIEPLQTYNNDIWYKIKLEINNVSKSYNVYINDQLIVTNYDFYSQAFNISKTFKWDCEQKCNEGSQMYKTVDGGQNWDLIELESGGTLTDRISICVTPIEPNSLFTCHVPFNSTHVIVKKSTDQGTTWSTVSNSNLTISGFGTWRNDIDVSPTDPQVIYIAGYYANKSTDGGYSFTSQANGQHVDCRIIEFIEGSSIGTQGSEDFIIQGHDGGVAISTQGGVPWYDINGTGLAITQYYAVGCSEKKYVLAGGTLDNDVSFYNGQNWEIPYLEQDGGEVVIDKNDPDVAYVQKWCCSANSQNLFKYVIIMEAIGLKLTILRLMVGMVII